MAADVAWLPHSAAMSMVAIVLIVVWLGLVAGARSILHARRTGRVATPPPVEPGSPRFWARVLSGIGFLLMAAAPIAELLGLPAIPALDVPLIRWMGVGVALLGIGAIWVAQSAMGTAWLPDVDPTVSTGLVTRGPFAIVRNPILSATIGTAAGVALVVPNLMAFLAVLAIVAGLQVQVRLVEEPYLERVHGDRYRAYQRRVGRFLPGIGRRR